MRSIAGISCLSAVALSLTLPTAPIWAQVEPPPTVEPLGNLQPPGPPDAAINALVKDHNKLVELGKALFWDTAAGGDGQACASCHFNAGADPRIANQLDPDLRAAPVGDPSFGGNQPVTALTRGGLLAGTGKKAGPNITLDAKDFPFHQHAVVTDRQSATTYLTNDVTSSQGVFDGTFIGLNPVVKLTSGTHDFCKPGPDGIFQITVNGVKRQVRKVEPRNTPTMINAAFFFRNFWDGRANNVFNGVNPFGERDNINGNPNGLAFIYKPVTPGVGPLQPVPLSLPDSSLASQAVGPPGSNFEMACASRNFATIGRKLLPRLGLSGIKIAATDSVLVTADQNGSGIGLKFTYDQLVQAAFQNDLWSVSGTFNDAGAVDPAGFTQKERNFSLFWGLAIDAYERTLISNQSPFDKGTLNAQQQAGLAVFTGQGKCVNCHTGPLFSAAAVPPRQRNELVERMIMGDDKVAFYDGGFYNIGVTPTRNDLGVGAKDGPHPLATFELSFTRQFVNPGQKVDPFDPAQQGPFAVPCPVSPCDLANDRIAVDGAFKTPSLRNVGLTAPYFHNGGEARLLDVVEFYNRGGNRCGQNGNDTTGSGAGGRHTGNEDLPQAPTPPCPQNIDNVVGSNHDPDVQPLGLNSTQKADLVAFLLALTDSRVACHAAPFDHPELVVTNGQKLTGGTGTKAADARLRLREVGKAGYANGVCAPNTGNLFSYNLIGTGSVLKMLEVLP